MPIFTTGAHLHPIKTRDLQGKELWVWAVAEFVDDSFKDGDVFNPPESAHKLEELMTDCLPPV